MWKRVLRIIAAVIIAPWATLLAVGLHIVVTGIIIGHEPHEMSLNYGMIAMYGMVIAYPATIIVGLPTHLLLSYLKAGHIWVHAVVGGGIALLISVFVFNLFTVGDWQVFIIYSTLLMVTGAAIAGVFGAIAGQPSLTKTVDD